MNDRAAQQQIESVLATAAAAPAMLAKATIYRARCGRRREYRSEADALAYEAGYGAWPHESPIYQSPHGDGWWDRESEQQELDDMRAEEAYQREECDE